MVLESYHRNLFRDDPVAVRGRAIAPGRSDPSKAGLDFLGQFYTMNLADIAAIRLNRQQISQSKSETVTDLMGWLGAIQAQDYAMAKWAIGVRQPNATIRDVETAINNGEILRTHLLRPTWHMAAAKDIYWLLELTAARIKASMRSRNQELELSTTVFTQSNTIIEKALSGGIHLTREEILVEIGNAGIALDNNRASHLLFQAELEGILCSGAEKNGKPTYALLAERVPQTHPIPKEEALARLAKIYFSSRCPASLQDFIWWSGLTVGDARQALELIKPDLASENIAGQTYWFPDSLCDIQKGKDSVYLLPAFDEYLISYTDRAAMLPFKNQLKVVSNNGIFRPIIVVNGQVTGVWKRTIKKDKVIVETVLFKPIDKTTQDLIEKAATQFGHFLGKENGIDHDIYSTGENT